MPCWSLSTEIYVYGVVLPLPLLLVGRPEKTPQGEKKRANFYAGMVASIGNLRAAQHGHAE